MTVTIGRRELLAALGGGAVAWPLAAGAQQPGRPWSACGSYSTCYDLQSRVRPSSLSHHGRS
jgi:hypothetical protein